MIVSIFLRLVTYPLVNVSSPTTPRYIVAVVTSVALYASEIWWKGQQERLENMQLLPTQSSKSHYMPHEDQRLIRLAFSPSFTVLRQISSTP
jgi:hypothetical protein